MPLLRALIPGLRRYLPKAQECALPKDQGSNEDTRNAASISLQDQSPASARAWIDATHINTYFHIAIGASGVKGGDAFAPIRAVSYED